MFKRKRKAELSNREFLEKVLQYREAYMKLTGLDPFLPSPIVQPIVTEDEVKAANAVAQAIKFALEITK